MIYLIIQTVAALLLVAAWFQGWLQALVIYDPTGIGQVIAALGIAGSLWMWSAWRRPRRSAAVLAGVNTLALWCVHLGLIGTLIGFVIMMANQGGADVSSAASMRAMAGAIFAGMGIALYTSLVGAFAALFLGVHRFVFKRVTRVASHEE